MHKKSREQGISLKSLIHLIFKNTFSIVYFSIVGLIMALVYTQFIVKPKFEASGNIENVGAVATALMTTITTIAQEEDTISEVVKEMDIIEEELVKINEIKKGLVVGSYNASTLKTEIRYSGSDKEEAEIIVNLIIDFSIVKFIDRNPSLDGKVKKQTDIIIANKTGPSIPLSYVAFVFIGATFGMFIGVGRDLIDRKIISSADIYEYNMPFSVISLKQDTKEKDILELDAFQKFIPVIFEDIEETIIRNKVKIIGVTNLGNENLNKLVIQLAENRSNENLKTLIIDLNFKEPLIQTFYDIKNNTYITDILQENNITPVKINDNLDVLLTRNYEYPARFLKDKKLKNSLNIYKKTYEYIFISLPLKDYYPAILFNQRLLDLLLLNISMGNTKMKQVDSYISGISENHRNKIFINAIGTTIKKDWFGFIKRRTRGSME